MLEIKKFLLIVAGIVFFILGLLGSLLPFVPGIPFFVAALICFSESSEKFYQALLNSPLIGSAMKKYQASQGIKLPWKVFLIVLPWTIATVAIIFFVPFFWARVSIGVSTLVGTIFILSLKTAKS
jgi:hypothetical protein